MNINTNSLLTRRHLIKGGAFAAAAVPFAGMVASPSAYADGAALDPNDSTAKALGFVTVSATPDQKCGQCALYQGKPGDAQGGCTIFAGKTVPASGWCKSWSKQT